MLLGSDLAAALSSSSSRGTSPGEAENWLMGGTNPAMFSHIRRQSLRQQTRTSPMPNYRSTASILRPSNDCRHFHYKTVELGPVRVEMEEKTDGGGGEEIVEQMRLAVESNGKRWTIARTFAEFCQLDRQLHRCIFTREHSRLEELSAECGCTVAQLRSYLQRLCLLTGSLMRCYSVLSFFELDNRGNHFHPAEYSQINIPAIACAVAIRSFVASCAGELELRVGDIVSVVEMPAGSEWWRGKLTVPSGRAEEGQGEEEQGAACKVGSFPSSSVRLFSDRLSLGEQIWLASQPKPGNRRGSAPFKLLSPLSSPAPRLKSLLRLAMPFSPGNTVFGKELAAFGGKVPSLVKECVALIEERGMVPGVYRQCGVQSNIRRLRREFHHNRCPQWDCPQLALLLRNDIHCVPSLLKQFFRQLPDPLLPFQLHPRFISLFSSDSKQSSQPEQLANVRALLEQLPPGHSQTARSLFLHLQRISVHPQTEMDGRSLAIVWAPNLLRCPPSQMSDWPNQLAGLELHTEICAFLIANADSLFGGQEEEARGRTEEPEEKEEEEEQQKLSSHQRRKRGSLICASGNVQPMEGGGQMQAKAELKAAGSSPRWRRLLESTSNSLEHSFQSILRRPSSSLVTSPKMGQRSQSVDRTKGGEEKQDQQRQRLLSPFGASVMRRVRSVRKSVRKLRPSTSASSPRPPSSSPADGAIPFVDETRPVSTSSSSQTMAQGAGEGGGGEEQPRRRVNFDDGGEGQGEGEEEGAESEEDSMPLDISRYDNVQSSILGAENGRIRSPPGEVARLKAKLRPLSLEGTVVHGENIYF